MAINETLFNLKLRTKTGLKRLQNTATENYFAMRKEVRIIAVLVILMLVFIAWSSLSGRVRTIEENENYVITYNPKTETYNASIIKSDNLQDTVNEINNKIKPEDNEQVVYDIPGALTGKTEEYFDAEEQFFDEKAFEKRQKEYNEQKKIFEDGPNVYE